MCDIALSFRDEQVKGQGHEPSDQLASGVQEDQ